MKKIGLPALLMLAVSSFAFESPSDLTYTTPVVYTVNLPITPDTPTVTDTVFLYSVAPALPAGLVLDSVSGVISGAPESASVATDYVVTASNDSGSTTDTINITVNERPSIVSDPMSQMVNAGSTVKFGVVAAGTAPLTYKWLFNDIDSVGNTDTLTLFNVQVSDTGFYSVVVSNLIGDTTSSNAALSLNKPPVISSQPVSQMANTGSTVKFGVQATGTAPLTYQWVKNNTDTVGLLDTLTLSNVQAVDTGSYKVLVHNVAGDTVSTSVTLGLNVAPLITSQPVVTQTVNADSSVTFGVVATGTGPLHYVWTKDDADSVGNQDTLVIASVVGADSGYYRCVVTNVAGVAASDSGVLIVHTPPEITSQPVSLMVNTGDTAQFVVVATGTAPVTYTWLKDNTDTVGTSDTLTLPNAQVSDVGTYQVFIHNSLGDLISDSVTLGLNVPSGILSQPVVTQTVLTGTTVKIGIVSVGTAPLHRKWLKNGVDSVGNQDTLTLSNVQLSDSGTYKCIVTNVAGIATSDSSILIVHALPVITSQSSSQMANAGSTVKFGVVVTGTTPLTYVWLKNNTDTVAFTDTLTILNFQAADTGSYRVFVHNIAGDTSSVSVTLGLNVAPNISSQPVTSQTVNSGVTVKLGVIATGTAQIHYKWVKNGVDSVGNLDTLTLVNVQGSDSGSYQCFVNNIAGVAPSNPGSLVVHYLPVILSQTSSQMANAGSTVKFGVVATGTAPLTYVWLKNNTDTVAFTDTLTILNFQASDTGSYQVFVHNIAGDTSSVSANLGLNILPSLTSQPVVSQTVNSGSTVKFGIGATGTNPLSYKWIHNGADSVGSSDTLTLINVQGSDSGSYQCFVTNVAGVAPSNSGTLHVQFVPVITSQPASQMVNSGSTATFGVVATGTAPLTYVWLKNNTDTVGSSDTLTLVNVQAADTGSYKVLIHNVAGDTSSVSVTLALNVAPSVTSQPASQVANETATVKFGVMASGTAPFSYKWLKNGVDSVGNLDTLTLVNVQGSDSGYYKCVVTNIAGVATSDSGVLTVNLAPVILSQPASQMVNAGSTVKFGVMAVGMDTLTYVWLKNNTDTVGTLDTLTLVNVQAADTGSYKVIVTNPLGDTTSNSVTLSLNVPASIVTQPIVSQTLVQGATAKFGVTASGTAPLFYKWLKNGVDSVGNLDTLTLVNVQGSDSGYYKCVVTNIAGVATSDSGVLQVLIAPMIAYVHNPAAYIKDSAITPDSVISTGGDVTHYALISPLPPGLSLDTLTGVISGTPTLQSLSADFSVIATGSGGSDTAVVNIGVFAIPSNFSYADDAAAYVLGLAITPNPPSITGFITHYSVSPAPPTGLVIDSLTGVLTGTPTTHQSFATDYTVTASNPLGSVQAIINITIVGVPTELSYIDDIPTYGRNIAISPPNVPTVQGIVTNYSILPALPTGITFDGTTGYIQGTPSVISPATNYTVTAQNPGGNTTAVIKIGVVNAGP